jgi:phage tail-like protein
MSNFAEILTASRFYLELKLDDGDDTVDATFLECQGFERTQEVIKFAEVTPQKWGESKKGRAVHTKVPGSSDAGNIILKRGMTNSTTLWQWFDAVEQGNWAKQVRDGSLAIYDQSGQEKARFEFLGAWPSRYKVSDVSASSTDIEIEELELAVETFKRTK